MYSAQREQILQSLESSHAAFYSSAVFGGPSMHFHHRALADAAGGSHHAFAESSYAMLASWGMHRMGRRGAKMAEFATYEASLQRTWPNIQQLQTKYPDSLTSENWIALQQVFLAVKAMRSAFSLVATSKVLAHALPNLVPPVDRQYTIKFLHRSKALPNDINGEWELLRGILESFFYPILQEGRFKDAAKRWCASEPPYLWDTSLLKIVDNLLVGHVWAETPNLSMHSDVAATRRRR
jgi:hypothetical protein